MNKRGASSGLILGGIIVIIALITTSFFIGKNVGEKKAEVLNNQTNIPAGQSNVQEQNEEQQNQQNPTESQTNNPEKSPRISELASCLQKVTAEKIPTSLKLFKSGNQVTYAGNPGKFVGTVQVDLNNNKRNVPSTGFRSSYINPTNYYNPLGQIVRITTIVSKINNQEEYNSIVDDLMTLKNNGSAEEADMKDSKLYIVDDSNKTYISNRWYAVPGDQQYLQFSFEGFNLEDSRLLIDQFVDTIC